MTYKTLMVHVQLRRSNEAVLKVAADLAHHFQAGVIGIAVCQPMRIMEGDVYLSGTVIDQAQAEITKEIEGAETVFRQTFGPGTETGPVDWRPAIILSSLPRHLANEARSADLIVTSMDRDNSVFDGSRHVSIGDLVLEAGRPLLVVPTVPVQPNLEQVVVGWKDTRESRRAISDALPLLRRASHISLVEIAAEDDLAKTRTHLAEITVWLARHGIAAEPIAVLSTGNDARQLAAIARDQEAGLIVAGGYGHSRLHEWVLGGVTHDLLQHASQCLLISH